jgi:peptide deformylase
VEKNYPRRLNLIVTDEKILRQISKEVTKVDAKVLKDMEDTMKKHNGIGISAIQIGVPQRIFLAGNPAQVFINPKIKDKSSYTKVDWEGCLSCPGAHVRVRRSHSITLEYEDIEGK